MQRAMVAAVMSGGSYRATNSSCGTKFLSTLCRHICQLFFATGILDAIDNDCVLFGLCNFVSNGFDDGVGH